VSQAAVVVILVGQILAELRSSCFFSFLGVLAIPTTRDISVSYIGAVLQLGMLRLVPVRHRRYSGFFLYVFFLLKDTRFNMRSRRLEWMELFLFSPQRPVSSHYIFSLFFYVPRDGNFAQIVVIQNLRSLYDANTRAHKMISISFSSRSWDKLTNNILNGALLEFDNCCVNVPRVT
jgi:hypothetical protein